MANLLLDGDMESATVLVDWALYVNGTFTKDTSSPHSGTRALRITHNGTNNPGVQKTLTVGSAYRISGWARGDGTTAYPVVYGNSSVLWFGTTSTSWQYFNIRYTPTIPNLVIRTLSNTIDTWAEFDDLVLQNTPTITIVSGLIKKRR